MNEVLKDLRLKLKMSQTDFAKAVGTSQASVSLFETGKFYPKKNCAHRILELAKEHNIELHLEDLYFE